MNKKKSEFHDLYNETGRLVKLIKEFTEFENVDGNSLKLLIERI